MNWYKHALLQRFDYQIPNNKKELMFDFYMLEVLRLFRFQSNVPSETEEDIVFAVKDIESKLVPFLRKELLDVVAISISSEFLYVFNEHDLNDFKTFKDLTHEQYALIEKIYYCNSTRNDIANLASSINASLDELDYESKYVERYTIIKKSLESTNSSSFTMEQFSYLAEKIFNEMHWEFGYGGEAWGDIVKVWRILLESGDKSFDNIVSAIDAMYSMQHNTGSVLNKLPSYRKDFSKEYGNRTEEIFTECLDLKFSSKNPWSLYDFCSSRMKQVASPILLAYGYGSKEEFINSEMYNGGNLLLGEAIMAGPEYVKNYLEHYKPKNIETFHFDLAKKNDIKSFKYLTRYENEHIGKNKSSLFINYNLIISIMLKNQHRFMEYLLNTPIYRQMILKMIGTSLKTDLFSTSLWVQKHLNEKNIYNVLSFYNNPPLMNDFTKNIIISFLRQLIIKKDYITNNVLIEVYERLPEELKNDQSINSILQTFLREKKFYEEHAEMLMHNDPADIQKEDLNYEIENNIEDDGPKI